MRSVLLATLIMPASMMVEAQESRAQDNVYDTEPVVLHTVEPVYPDEAKAAGVEGEVILEVRVETNGSTTYLSVIKSLGYGCTEAAIEAAKQWSWEPARREGKRVEAVGIIALQFPPREP